MKDAPASPTSKARLLLRQMEEAFGRESFDRFLRSYFQRFAFQSITTAEALDYIRQELFAKNPQQAAAIDLDEWVFQPGLPAGAPQAFSPKLAEVRRAAERSSSWNTQQWLEFLQTLPRPVDRSVLAKLDAGFHLTSTANYEILSEWLLLCIEADYKEAFGRLENFLLTVGRMKYLRPLYGELMKSPAGQQMALDIYRKARPLYHPIARTAVEKVLLFQQKATGE